MFLLPEGQLRFHVQDLPWTDRIALNFAVVSQRDQTVWYPEPIVFKAQAEPGIQPHDNVLEIEPAAARQLMDALWQCGIRPSNGEGSVGQLGATQAHLKEMQQILKFVLPHSLRAAETVNPMPENL